MTAEANKAVFRRFEDTVGSGDLALIHQSIDDAFQPDVLIRTPLPVDATGVEAMKQVWTMLLRAYPDINITIEEMVAEDDLVAVRNTVTGTNLGEYMGRPPTGRRVTYPEMFILRFTDGRVAETWGVVDVLSQLTQLGVVEL